MKSFAGRFALNPIIPLELGGMYDVDEEDPNGADGELCIE